MALISASTLKREFDFIYADDPALDKENPLFDYDAWQDTGELSRLPCKEGQSPTVFRCHKLSASITMDIEFALRRAQSMNEDAATNYGLSLAALSAVKHGLKSVENWDIELEFESGALTDASLDRLYDVAPGLVGHMGLTIYRESAGLSSSPKQ